MSISTAQLIQKTLTYRQSLELDHLIDVKNIMSDIESQMRNQCIFLKDKQLLFDATKVNIIQYLPAKQQYYYISNLEHILSKHKYNPAWTYSDSINFPNTIRLEVIDFKFILNHINEFPLTTMFKSKYIFANNVRQRNHRLCFLFNIEDEPESQRLFKMIKEGSVCKIFDGKCELFIENQVRNNIQLLSNDFSPQFLPNFIINGILNTPELILQELVSCCTHKLVSELLLVLPTYDFVTTLYDTNTVVYYYNNKTQLYKKIKQDSICAHLQEVAIHFINSKKLPLRNEIEKSTKQYFLTNKNILELNAKLLTFNKSCSKQQLILKKKIEEDLVKLNNDLQSLSEKNNELNMTLEQYNTIFIKLGTIPFMENVTKAFIMEKSLFKADFIDLLDSRHDVFNFKDGIFEFRLNRFRKRTIDDYFSKTVNYCYGDGSYNVEIYKRWKKIFFQICNDNKKFAEAYKSWLGYCMTGEICEEKSWWNIGEKAQNGKTTVVDGFDHMAHIYCVKLNNKTFNKDFNNRHKQLTRLKLMRMAYLEEIDQKSLDIQVFKDYTGSSKIGGNEILYGTSEDIYILCKFMFISNSYPKFKSDAGVARRGICLEHSNRFLETYEYQKHSHEKGVYPRDKDLKTNIATDQYKLALFHLLVPYAMRYYESKFTLVDMSELEQNWTSICVENDSIASFVDNYYELTNKDSDRIHKDDFLDHYRQASNNKNYGWNTLISDIKRIGLVYDRQKKVNNKRGVLVGIIKLNNNKQNSTSDIDFIKDI